MITTTKDRLLGQDMATNPTAHLRWSIKVPPTTQTTTSMHPTPNNNKRTLPVTTSRRRLLEITPILTLMLELLRIPTLLIIQQTTLANLLSNIHMDMILMVTAKLT